MHQVNTNAIPKILNDVATPYWYHSGMGNDNEEEQARTIRMPRAIWAALDAEAVKNNRSPVKQMTTIMTAYFERYLEPNVRDDDIKKARRYARSSEGEMSERNDPQRSEKKRAKG